ncbi:AbrB/MazE/SpoVT family DNA-binding domain-containing protein [Gammaproteobacteria bacterium]|jgi:antitoxin MazE|nr:AbrB/MazE/SpoVT family DNA-binding domain-containing protein [Gammaproteobacteria bacterium]|tara:strand:- start:841 stop:1077 length:237 start_codon:yes stop_codon:yes gene_type:complete
MISKIGIWGGSCALRLPKMAVESLGLKEGEEVKLQLEDGALIVRPAKQRFLLEDLVQEARGLTAPAVIDDDPLGSELL